MFKVEKSKQLKIKNPCKNKGLKSKENWLRGQDSNLRPSGYEPDELPDCSTPRHVSHSKVAMASGNLLPTAQESRRSYMSDEESSSEAKFKGFYSPSNHAGTSGDGLPVEMTQS